MEAFRIDIHAWTASFRYPNLISGIQPTLEAPPVSTVLGLLNAAAGKYLQHHKLEIGYYFQYQMKAVDLETIYQIEGKDGKATNNAKSNIVQREFLFNPQLSLYLKDENLVDYLRRPQYDILLGRSGDLAMVSVPKRVELAEITGASRIKGQVIPLRGHNLPGKIQALPKYFSNDFPRKNIGTEPYSVIGYNTIDINTNIKAYRDESLGKQGIDIYFHQLDFSSYV